MSKRVVILVDNKKRDLPGAALTAYHLNKLDIECFLEPLEAWRAVLYAHKPHFILFNHLLASHLENYSRELHAIGVKVGVLLNEGIIYSEEFMAFNVSKFHNSAHIDHFFVWNHVHKAAIQKIANANIQNIITVGVPRFDFHFFPLAPVRTKPIPTVLVCSNFVFAKYEDKPKSIADKLFSPWKDRIPSFSNYHALIKDNAKSRQLFLEHITFLVKCHRFNVILKPHPSEEIEIYNRWYNALSQQDQEYLEFDTTSAIWELIPQCDIEVACETCTTTLEAWIGKKPTIELLLTKNPIFYHPFIADLSLVCEKPERLPDLIDQALKGIMPNKSKEIKSHLAKWCHNPEGFSTQALAQHIQKSMLDGYPNFSSVSWGNKRRGYKLKILRCLNLPYNYNPFSNIRNKLNPNKYKEKDRIFNKTIRPSDQRYWVDKITNLFDQSYE